MLSCDIYDMAGLRTLYMILIEYLSSFSSNKPSIANSVDLESNPSNDLICASTAKRCSGVAFALFANSSQRPDGYSSCDIQ